MLDGTPVINRAGPDTLGLFVTHLLLYLTEMKLKVPNLLNYYGSVSLKYKRKIVSKVNGKFEDLF